VHSYASETGLLRYAIVKSKFPSTEFVFGANEKNANMLRKKCHPSEWLNMLVNRT